MSKRTWISGFKLNIHAPGTWFALMLLALTQVPVAIKTTAEIFFMEKLGEKIVWLGLIKINKYTSSFTVSIKGREATAINSITHPVNRPVSTLKNSGVNAIW